MHFMIDSRYFSGDPTLEIEMLTKLREKNVEVLQGRSPSSPEEFSSIKNLSAQALRSIPLANSYYSMTEVSTNSAVRVELSKR